MRVRELVTLEPTGDTGELRALIVADPMSNLSGAINECNCLNQDSELAEMLVRAKAPLIGIRGVIHILSIIIR